MASLVVEIFHVLNQWDPDPVQFDVSDLDYVPVCDQPNEAGIPGGERTTAQPSSLPEGETRQEEHGSMRSFQTGHP